MLRHPFGGLRRGASFGRKIHRARRALVHAMAFVLGLFRWFCVAVRVLGYLTGAILLVAGASILLDKKTSIAATYLGAWMVLLVLFIYGPILIAQISDPSTAVKVEGINYFADALLFAGAILALANATPRTD
jgi:hypothetical protein